ncbi:uncharacterized protein TNCV_1445371 [Trichonephila clavipes]|nr:uncharacterized protein TNCV_1445371 [Trichonephila clavipes]
MRAALDPHPSSPPFRVVPPAWKLDFSGMEPGFYGARKPDCHQVPTLCKIQFEGPKPDFAEEPTCSMLRHWFEWHKQFSGGIDRVEDDKPAGCSIVERRLSESIGIGQRSDTRLFIKPKTEGDPCSIWNRIRIVAAVAEWYRYRTVACFVTGSSPVPLKTRRVGQRCTLNLSRAETSSRWCGVVVRRGRCQLRCRPRHLTMVQNYVVRRQKPSCS